MRTSFAHGIRTALALASVLLHAVRVAEGQTVGGRVVAKTDGAPVPGAIVALLDSAGHGVITRLAEDAGTFSFVVPAPGRYAVRVERVGFRSTTSPWFLVRQGETITIPMAIASESLTLRAIVVNADRRCLVRPREGAATAELWNEARKALSATQLTQIAQAAAKARRDPHRFVVRWRSTTRDLDPTSLAVLHNEQFENEGETVKPFASADPEQLARDGYMTGDIDTGSTYFAPDADILLSDQFLDSHCFRLQWPDSGRRDDLIGLAFEPANLTTQRRPGRVDVRGVLWLDRASAELRYMQYQYVNLAVEEMSRYAGGLLEFRPLPDGRWIVWRWYIRMPALVRRRGMLNSQLTDWHTEVAKIREDGAEVLSVMPAGTRRPARATLRGTVIDSLSGAAMAGVRVFLSGTSFAAVTQMDGSYVIDSVPAGRYTASIVASRLDTLLLEPPVRALTVSAGENKRVDLALPSLRTLSSRVCRQPMPDSLSMILGVVRDSTTAASDVQVRAEWTEYSKASTDRLRAQQTWNETTTTKGGRYSLCGLPAGRTITVRAVRGRASVASPQRPVAPGEVRRVDLMLRNP
ncbi:MAG TPA: carboxypeptidase regulatory-like domain-containing protein [Gemmatimonadaceae bacterium]|jgi:hypothetical protein